jgi:hypothetical protein
LLIFLIERLGPQGDALAAPRERRAISSTDPI